MTHIYGFHHICFDKNGKDIFEEQLSTLMSSGLYAASTAIYCSVLGLFHYNKPYESAIYKNYPQIPLIFTPGLSDTNSNTFS
jgi:hypothetical protein